jgi:hypothetical protein
MPEFWKPAKNEFTIAADRVVELESLQIHLTYGGILEIELNERNNRLVLEHLEIPSLWKGKKISIDTPEDLSKALPGFVCFAEFTSNEGITDKSMRSELKHIFFMNSLEEKPIREIIQEELNKINWDEFAEEFEFNP